MSSANLIASVAYCNIQSLPGYRVGDDGSIWSCRDSQGNIGTTWHRIKDAPHSRGYRTVTVRPERNGKVVCRYVHRLVLENFVGPCPAGMECCHRNGNRADNRLDNLRWGTRKSNFADKVDHGTQTRGSAHPGSKLTEADIPRIRDMARAGVLQARIGEIFGVNQVTISSIVRFKTWRHIL